MNTIPRIYEPSRDRGAGRTLIRPLVAAALFLSTFALAGCDVDQLLEVPDPDVATEESILQPSALPVVFAGAVRDFQVAYTGFPSAQLDEGYVLMSSLLTDEYDSGGTFNTRIEVDRRDINVDNSTAQDFFRALQRARVSAERAVGAFEEVDPDDPRRAEAANLAGMTYIFFGEMYCSGVPFSETPRGQPFEFGAPTPTDEIFQRAMERFDAALDVPGASLEQVAFSRLGKARALLNLDRVDEAGALAAQVPTDFEYVLEHSANSTTQNNGIWAAVNNIRRYRIPDRHGENGLPYRSADDPRVQWFIAGAAFDQNLTGFAQEKYPARESPVWPAQGMEARLIEAEAALRSGDVNAFVAIHNQLRASVAGLDPFEVATVETMTEAERVDLHFRERAFWLWQTGHRLGDLRRLIRQYGRSQDQVFPSGSYFKGGSFGTDVNFPIPTDELNNPQFDGCLNRDA